MTLRLLPFLAALLLVGTAMGQGKGKKKNEDRNSPQGPHAELYLPVECHVTANGAPTDNITLTVFKDNEVAFELSPEKNKSHFLLDLDMDSYYTIRAGKEGYREKTVFIDTHLPENEVKYKNTSFGLNLEVMDKYAHSDPFYLDFPSAIIQWDGPKRTFSPNAGYLADIQLKMALLGAQAETR